MKKFITISVFLLLLSFNGFSQRNLLITRSNSYSLSGWERLQMQRNVLQLRASTRLARQDGVVTQREKRKIRQLKAKTRRDAIRFRYNRRPII
ncbi:MAG TPA: hypothetical protein PLZ10_10465 [Chitinophagaceae bacterium]|nr:hypothetical protein [Chitinophagaceae bacterium]